MPHAGINFDRQHDGISAYEAWSRGVLGDSSAFVEATANLYLAGGPLIEDIAANWFKGYRGGLPEVDGGGVLIPTPDGLVPPA